VPESAVIRALVERGYLGTIDIAELLGVTKQQAGQISRRPGFPAPAKTVGKRRLWRRCDVERWQGARPRAWAPANMGG
jgi:hypothetical protein